MANRQGWGRLGYRRVGTPPESGGAALAGVATFWDSSKWYPAADFVLGGSNTLPYSTIGAADLLYSFQVTFCRPGVITGIGQHIGNNNGRVWMAVYDSAANAPEIPTDRLFDIEKVAVGFNAPCLATGLSIPVTAGKTLWFAAVYNAGGVGGGCINISPSNTREANGTNYDGSAGPPTIAFIAGYKPALAYGRPPATFPGPSPTPLLSNGPNVPCMVYQFTPTAV